MYKLEILPIAKKDMDDIVYYISNNLKNRTAARDLADNFIIGANNILKFPYGSSVYKVSKKLEYEYRSARVKNFLMFYTINEKEKVVTIARVLYKKMDINNILEN